MRAFIPTAHTSTNPKDSTNSPLSQTPLITPGAEKEEIKNGIRSGVGRDQQRGLVPIRSLLTTVEKLIGGIISGDDQKLEKVNICEIKVRLLVVEFSLLNWYGRKVCCVGSCNCLKNVLEIVFCYVMEIYAIV